MRRSTARLARACATTVPLRRGKAAEWGPCAQHGVALACDAESIGGRACVVIGGGGRGDGADRYVSAHSSRTPWGPNGLPLRRCECQGHACNTVACRCAACHPSRRRSCVCAAANRSRRAQSPIGACHRCRWAMATAGVAGGLRCAELYKRCGVAERRGSGGRAGGRHGSTSHSSIMLFSSSATRAARRGTNVTAARMQRERGSIDTFGFHLHVNLVTGNHARLILIGFLPQNLPAAGAFPTATSARRELVSERGRAWHWNT